MELSLYDVKWHINVHKNLFDRDTVNFLIFYLSLSYETSN